MAAPRPPLGEASTWICWEGLSTKPPVGWDIARGKIFVKLQSACVQHIQLKAKSLCENMQLDMQSKRIFNVFPLVQIQHAVHSGMLHALFYWRQAYISSLHTSVISLTHNGNLHVIRDHIHCCDESWGEQWKIFWQREEHLANHRLVIYGQINELQLTEVLS